MTRDELLERGDETVTIRQIVDRFDAVEEEYSGIPWTLTQIYTQIDMLVSEKPCGDCISREAVENAIKHAEVNFTVNSDIDFTKHKREVQEIVNGIIDAQIKALRDLPSVTPQPKMGHCKDCKYFEYDSVAKVNGIPLIVAHEICSRWGDGCKSKEDGYCFLFEPKTQEVKE